ncbi:DNA polymerase Y family protein [Lysobacter yananisis]|uniref:DNA polymerase Y family protein n=1 Tax=Lysobacter yananisis TaxID=1003114 RepID=A0ABY9P625_9GAMM|nr:DNA polymerase Y family protein [Lysobacter yananisis]WMT02449.1 DNA polymerase Y family protein [Lysobacter yananisis]
MRWACLLLPQLAMDVVLRQHPNPDQPLALVEGPHARRRLHSVNAAARALGLRPGLSLVAAHAIADGVRTAEYDPQAAERARQLLAAWAYRYSSQVSTDFAHALVLEIAGSRRLFGAWPQLRQRLDAELRELGFRHRMAAAPNPFAARALTNIGEGLFFDDDLLLPALAKMPIERSGLDPATVQALQRMGLRKLGAVFALPRAPLARRFGPDLLQRLDALRGAAEPPLTFYQPPDAFDARIELGHEAESSQALLFPLRRLTADLAAYLSGRDGGVARFKLLLEHERHSHRLQHPPSEIAVGLLAPEREAAMLFELARGRLQHAQLPAPVVALRLLAEELPPFVPAARDLFDPRPQQALPWAQLRERLRARLGDERVHGLAAHPDHRPERAWQPVLGDAPVARGKHAATPAPTRPATRPGWLLAEPEPLREPVARILAGPERIESGWWDQDDVRRDYYLVETARGQRAWAYRDAGGDGPLIVHGWFA